MKCEKGVKKGGPRECSGRFCEPDFFTATRIAQNFTDRELSKRIAKVESRLDQNLKAARYRRDTIN